MLKILIKIITARPILDFIAKKTNGYKTIIGIIGTIASLIAYIAANLYPDLVDPNLLPPQKLEQVLLTAIGGSFSLAFGGAMHKVKKEKKEKEMLQKELETVKQKIVSNYQDYERH